MISFHSSRARDLGRAITLLAATGLICAVPARADSPQPRDEVETAVASDAALAAQGPEAEADLSTDEMTYEPIGEGEASYYGHELAGNRTASGERFDPKALTAAHRTLPMGSMLRVTNTSNGKSVIVRINDRGPFTGNRIIDISLAAARQISMVGPGKAMVRLDLLS
ncbi:MAG TPA: septal ring lytic transglycosylase RlpA family protein [Allosphingosinicella sp.]